MPATHPIRFIAFDGDETLWRFWESVRLSLQGTISDIETLLDKNVPGLTVESLIRIREDVDLDFSGTLIEMRVESLRRALTQVGGDPNDARDLTTRYLVHRRRNTTLYEDVIPSLDALIGLNALADHTTRPSLNSLDSGFVLGLISNGNTHPDKVGLGGRFAVVEHAEVTGCAKPDPEIFGIACSKAQCQPEELLYIGDSPLHDVHGANAFGAHSVWLNRDSVANDTEHQPDFEIRSLMELGGVLEALSSGR